ncbi:MAG TPA: ribosome maturation factor RimM [Bacteroidota bacterium]|nr:ribosome maturation factor RimM [Bacteroidota bacterium]
MELIAVAKIIKPIGVRGEIKLQLLTDDSERLKLLASVWIGKREQAVTEHKVLCLRQNVKQGVASVRGVETLEAAEALRDQFIFVSNHEIMQPNAGRYFVDDILGCAMVAQDGKQIGTIVDVLALPANDLWVVKNGKKEILIPAVKAIVKEVDVKQKRVVIDSPEGLID